MTSAAANGPQADSYLIGIDLGGTHFQIGIIAEDGNNTIRGRARGMTLAGEGGGTAIVERLVGGIDAACADAGITLDAVRGIGVGTPAPIDPTFRIAVHAVNLGWRNFPLAEHLTQKLSRDIAVTLDNDVNCAVWGEHCLGAGRGFSSLLGLWIGTGIGGGLVFDNTLFHGACGTAGEIGMSVLYPNKKSPDWRYENHASRKSILTQLQTALENGASSILQKISAQNNRQTFSAADIATAVGAGDDLTCRIVRNSAHQTGVMAANAVTMLSLDCIVLGGGLAEEIGQTYINWLRETFDEAVFPPTLRSCTIRPTELKENAGLLGAALLARTRLT